jgi:glycerol-3-phosphate acyltransferase PlsX
MTLISIDAMGGDHGPPVAVAAVALHAGLWREKGVRFLLHGDENRIETELARTPAARALCEVRHTDKVIGGDEKPAQAMRRGKGSSLWNAVDSVRAGEAAAAVSAGNTGALMAVSKLILRMMADLERPALVATWPNAKGFCTVLDVGANVDCDAQRLVEFAIMGEAFHRAVHNAARPSVGLLNVGSEEQKGHDEVREAHRLLREGGVDVNYLGFVEGDDIAKGGADVVVTDGFTGNVALKTTEGAARFIRNELRAALSSSWLTKLGALIAQAGLKRLSRRLEPPDGAPLLGLNGIVVKCHGGAEARGFASALQVAVNLAQSRYAEEIERNLQRLTRALADSAMEGSPPGGAASAASENFG